MIKLGHFRKIDLLAIFILAFLWSGLTYIIMFYFPYIFEVILFATALFATFIALLIRKVGSVTLFFSFAGVMTLVVPILGVLGFDKILVLVSMGLVFEFIIYIFKKYLNLIIAGTISNASMPWLMALSKNQFSTNLSYALWNFTIISALLGVLGALVGMGIWYKVKNSKLVLKFEYERGF